jgi:EmrB/QacA subfamily drug resistance transporter
VPRTKRLTLAATILGSAIVFVDGTVVNVALPALRADLGASLAGQQWIVEAYLLMLGSLILVGGSLGDVLGRRKVFAIGVAGFGVTSLMCAVAPSTGVLIAARTLQGVAGALLVPSSLAIITACFDETERPAAIGSWTAWTSGAIAVGPPLGGVLVDAISWRLVFAINVPLVLATLYLIARAVPPMEGRSDEHVDIPGAVLCTLGLGGPVYALIEQQAKGWGDPTVLIPLVGGLTLFGLFLNRERTHPDPMVPLHLFRKRNFAVGNAATLLIYAGLGSATFFIALFLQQIGGYKATAAGLALLPITVMLVVLSRRFGALAARIGPRALMGFGPLVAAVGLALYMRLDADPSYISEVLPATLVFGLGLAMTVAPLTSTVLGAADQEHAGVASGVNNAIARVAGLLAIAAIGAVVAASYSSSLDSRLPAGVRNDPAVTAAKARPLVHVADNRLPLGSAQAFRAAETGASVHAFRAGMLVSALLVAIGGVLALLGIQNPRRREPEPTPAEAVRHPCAAASFTGPGGPELPRARVLPALSPRSPPR